MSTAVKEHGVLNGDKRIDSGVTTFGKTIDSKTFHKVSAVKKRTSSQSFKEKIEKK
jgi:hypothetical protein